MSCINGSVSDPFIITTGVPQGSILPLLFTIYMNDLPNCLQHCKTNMYADDTGICVSARDKASVTQLMQDDLIMTRLCANTLSLYIGKTSCMLITSAQRRGRMSHDHLDLSLNDNQIEHVIASPFLGITIDQNINFNIGLQTDNICNKANRALGDLKRAATFLPIDPLALMFNTIVLQHLD